MSDFAYLPEDFLVHPFFDVFASKPVPFRLPDNLSPAIEVHVTCVFQLMFKYCIFPDHVDTRQTLVDHPGNDPGFARCPRLRVSGTHFRL